MFEFCCQNRDKCNTLFEIFIFCPKIQLWFRKKIVDFFGWKTRENVVVLDFLAVDNFDFTKKVKKKSKTFRIVYTFAKFEFRSFSIINDFILLNSKLLEYPIESGIHNCCIKIYMIRIVLNLITPDLCIIHGKKVQSWLTPLEKLSWFWKHFPFRKP